MGKNYRFYLSFFWILLGVVLCICNGLGWIEDYWFSMGGAFIVVGSLQVIRHIRYRTDKAGIIHCTIGKADTRQKGHSFLLSLGFCFL